MAVSLAFFSGTASAHTTSFNQRAASYVETFIGRVPYTYGGTSPSSGFDCSGLAQYVYHHYGKSIPRTAEAQFLRFRRESKHAAWVGTSFSSTWIRTPTATSTTWPFTRATITSSRRPTQHKGSPGRKSGTPM